MNTKMDLEVEGMRMRTTMNGRTWGRVAGICALVMLLCGMLTRPAAALRIRDAVRLKNEVPNQLIGMGLVVGLPETGDGDSFLPAMQALKSVLKKFDNPV